MYQFNDSRVFADFADDQYVVLNFVTGEYYAFDKTSSAILNALTSGCSRDAVIRSLIGRFGETCGVEENVDGFIERLTAMEILIPGDEGSGDADPFVDAIEEVTLPLLGFERYTDVADLLLMDPIHEVDEQMGWPVPKE